MLHRRLWAAAYYDYSLLAHLRLGSTSGELFGVAKSSTGPLSPGAPGPEVAAGDCGNPTEMKGIPKCRGDGGPIDGKRPSENAQATKNQSSAKTMTTDPGEDDVALTRPVRGAIYVSPAFWRWRECAGAYCNTVMDSLTADETRSTLLFEPTPIPEYLIVDSLDPPNFDPPPYTPSPEFGPTPATSVPEPSTLILVFLGFLGLALMLEKERLRNRAW